MCLPLSLSLYPLHGDLGGCPFLAEQPREEGRQCVLHLALYSSEQELKLLYEASEISGISCYCRTLKPSPDQQNQHLILVFSGTG